MIAVATGYGLSYSNWSASATPLQPSATISAKALSAGSNLTLTVTIRNTAGPAGARVVYAMLKRQGAAPQEAWAHSWLPVHGFAKVHHVAAGSSAATTLTLTARDLSRWDEASHRFTVRPGVFELRLRDAEDAAPITLTVTTYVT
jgi:beta-glucosidase